MVPEASRMTTPGAWRTSPVRRPWRSAAQGGDVAPPRGGPEPLVPADPLDPEGPVEVLVGIDQRREGEPVAHQLAGLEAGAGGHGEGSGAEGFDLGMGLPQLREQVQAGNSAVVAQELDHGGAIQVVRQRDGRAVGCHQPDLADAVADVHGDRPFAAAVQGVAPCVPGAREGRRGGR